MILELDLGNTRGKWRMLDGERCAARGIGKVAEWARGELPAEWSGIARIRAASVLTDAAGSALSDVLLQRFGAAIEFARSTVECAGVRSGYEQPEKLGVDRWLGLLAAYGEFRRAVVVVSVGTALTVDYVDAVGTHRGGYIIPGARLMAESLLRSTDRVRFDGLPSLASTEPGRHTGECVHGGVALALAGAVRLALVQAREVMGEVDWVLAGGDAAALAALLKEERAALRPDLVLDGLRLALP